MIPKLLNKTFLALGGLPLLSSVVFAQEQDVDLELVLAVDVSRSMDLAEQQLQKDGYIAALQHPEVLAAIRAGLLGKIAVTYVEWAGASAQQVVASWALIEDAQSAALLQARSWPPKARIYGAPPYRER